MNSTELLSVLKACPNVECRRAIVKERPESFSEMANEALRALDKHEELVHRARRALVDFKDELTGAMVHRERAASGNAIVLAILLGFAIALFIFAMCKPRRRQRNTLHLPSIDDHLQRDKPYIASADGESADNATADDEITDGETVDNLANK